MNLGGCLWVLQVPGGGWTGILVALVWLALAGMIQAMDSD